nr:MAG TPA: hypothetical protein [Caudoviricetes sp.]
MAVSRPTSTVGQRLGGGQYPPKFQYVICATKVSMCARICGKGWGQGYTVLSIPGSPETGDL